MPLLGKSPFVKQELPRDLPDDQEVFYHALTGEAFLEYDAYCERSILCSSMVWTCSVTGKANLTYQEALESELQSQSLVDALPLAIRKAILFIARYVNRPRHSDFLLLILPFITNRYFVGEEVDVYLESRRMRGRIVRVIAPTADEIQDSEYHASGHQSVAYGLDPTIYKYEVVDTKDENCREIVTAQKVVRPMGFLNKEKLRLFLKQHLIQQRRFERVAVSQESEKEFGLDEITWEGENGIFDGPEPNFEDETVLVRNYPKEKKRYRGAGGQSESESDGEGGEGHDGEEKKKRKRKKKNQEETPPKPKPPELTPEERERLREEARQRRNEQKRLQRQKVREEKQKEQERIEAWSRKRDDLLCDDLKPLPKPTPVDCSIPPKHFGDAVMLLEFLNVFTDFLDLKEFFPNGINMELLEQILLDRDLHGPLGDVLKILLQTTFVLQEEDEKYIIQSQPSKEEEPQNPVDLGEKPEEPEDEEKHPDQEDEAHDDLDGTDAAKAAVKGAREAVSMIQQYHSTKLQDIEIDPFTITEVVRLHLISSGSLPRQKTVQRGWYEAHEDPCLRLRLSEPELIDKLQNQSIFELTLSDRLKILHALIHQILSYISYRDLLENAFNSMIQTKREIRETTQEFTKWERENAVKRPNPQNVLNKLQETQDPNKTDEMEPIQQMEQVQEAMNEEYQKSLKEYNDKRHELALNVEERLKSLKQTLVHWNARYNGKSLGYDRAFRRYWRFYSLPGIFVEHDLEIIGGCLEELGKNDTEEEPELDPVMKKKVLKKLIHSVYDEISGAAANKENKKPEESENGDQEDQEESCNAEEHASELTEFDRCSGKEETCAVHGKHLINERLPWGFYYKDEDIDALLNALNPRGYRESNLREAIKADELTIKESLESEPVAHHLNKYVRVSDKAKKQSKYVHKKTLGSVYSEMKPTLAIERSLRDVMLEIEEKIFTGGLGSLPDRAKWREQLESSQQPVKVLAKSIHELSKALYSHFLGKPLNEDNGAFDRWVDGLNECSSYSQLHVFLATLDKSIIWSKSALKAYCKICRRKGDAQSMVLCNGCSRGHHIYCLKPPLEKMPTEAWYCSECRPKMIPATPRKEPKAQLEDTDEEVDDEDYEEEDDENEDSEHNDTLSESVGISQPASPLMNGNDSADGSEEEVSSEEEPPRLVCHYCDGNDFNVQCSTCSRCYHLDCHRPPLTRMPRGQWTCGDCIKRKDEPKNSEKRKPKARYEDDYEYEGPSSKRQKGSRSKYENGDKDYSDSEDSDTQTLKNLTKLKKAKLSFATKLFPVDYSLCEEIMRKLNRHEDSWPFRKKPTEKEAPNYTKVVKKYVDLGIIASKLNDGKYKSTNEWVSDVFLMFQNCSFYWPSYSAVAKAGCKFRKYFEGLLEEQGFDPLSFSAL